MQRCLKKCSAFVHMHILGNLPDTLERFTKMCAAISRGQLSRIISGLPQSRLPLQGPSTLNIKRDGSRPMIFLGMKQVDIVINPRLDVALRQGPAQESVINAGAAPSIVDICGWNPEAY